VIDVLAGVKLLSPGTGQSEGGALWAFHNNSEASISNKDYRDVEGTRS